METDALRWFQQVADGVTVTEVAETYLVSQPGVSRALARLEDEVGTPLLRRTGRVLRTTHAGSVFKRHVDDLLHGLDDGLAAVNELVDPETGTVNVAFQQSLGTWLVPSMIGRFRRCHPRVQFTLEQSHDVLGSSMLTGGRVDLEFTARRPHSPEVHWEPLLEQPLFLAVPSTHRLARARSAALAEVADDDFVMLRPTWELRIRTEELCAAAGFSPRTGLEGDDLPVVRGLVAAGLGVAVVPASSTDTRGAHPQGERLIRLTDTGAHRQIGLSWPLGRALLPSAELFRTHVLDVARNEALASPAQP